MITWNLKDIFPRALYRFYHFSFATKGNKMDCWKNHQNSYLCWECSRIGSFGEGSTWWDFLGSFQWKSPWFQEFWWFDWETLKNWRFFHDTLFLPLFPFQKKHLQVVWFCIGILFELGHPTNNFELILKRKGKITERGLVFFPYLWMTE